MCNRDWLVWIVRNKDYCKIKYHSLIVVLAAAKSGIGDHTTKDRLLLPENTWHHFINMKKNCWNKLSKRTFKWTHILARWHLNHNVKCFYLYPRPTKLEGGYTGFTLSVRLSVCPSVCRRHGFRSISQVCFGISISNFICMLMVAIGRSLLIFSVVTFKMAAWRPYWIFWFPDSNFSLALNIKFKLQGHNTYVYG